jgi:Tfp pilus assembly ATPase PilU
MQLLDDALFDLWHTKKCSREDVMAKAQDAADLAKKISAVERGVLDEEIDEE